jgi:putative PIN family toxin of toxin-antitoxin system
MKADKPRVVLDTNVLLVSISSKSKYHWIFESLLKSEYELYITNDILTEYEEIISNKFSLSAAKNIIRALLLLPNVLKVDIYYNWNMISVDPDDNKFVDCAVVANADLLTTHDKHFSILKNIEFPKVSVVDTEMFKSIIFCKN